LLPERLLASTGTITSPAERDVLRRLDKRALAARAVEAAKAAGAQYADVRLTHTWERSFGNTSLKDDAEGMAVGVRALVDGRWGFASSSYWTEDEMARLGREAAGQAKTTIAGRGPRVDLGTIPVVRDGEWIAPVKVDPFTVPIDEIVDFAGGLRLFTSLGYGGTAIGPKGVSLHVELSFWRQEKTFASTQGSSFVQTTYRNASEFTVNYRHRDRSGAASVDFLPPTGHGWEYIRDAEGRLRDAIPELIAEVQESWRLPTKPVEVGRYDVVLDAASVANLLGGTIGGATDLDVAMGYESNAGGTSYLNDPLGMVGAYQLGPPLLTVTANRSLPGGLATVRWDDEGVEPDEFAIVRDGVLADFPTTRESAAWLTGSAAARGRTPRSHGCAAADSGLDAPLLHTPNLALTPAPGGPSFEELVAGTTKGLAIRQAQGNMDFQHLNGLGTGAVYEMRNGKRVARIAGAGFLFRTPELWRSVQALGGPNDLRWFGAVSTKGEPAQAVPFSVGAVPAALKQLAIIDLERKA
jgi:TldD protein